jgi:lipoyl-dependent peroxiredoxin
MEKARSQPTAEFYLIPRIPAEPVSNREKARTRKNLIAAAHAGCFSMALSLELGKAGLTAESIHTTASVTLDKAEAGFVITAVHLDLNARIPDADQQQFETAANTAKAGCPVSKALKAKITLAARLEN